MALGFYGFRKSFPYVETGFSETLGDLQGKQRNPVSGGSMVKGGGSYPNPSPYNPAGGGGKVLGQTTGPVYTPQNQEYFGSYGGDGGSGGGGGGGGAINQQNAPFEETPSEPDFSIYDEAYATAEGALNEASAAAQQGINASLGEINASGQQRAQQARSAEGEKLGALGEQRTEATQGAENAISEARRQSSELQQGLQARYGRSTGTGQFAGELLGRQTMQNIGQNRQALQSTVAKIGAAENRVREETARLLDQVETDTQNARESARAQLAQILASISAKKGELQQAKADRRMQALQDYQQLVSSINARNAAYKQQLFDRAQKTASSINNFRQQAIEQFQANFQDFTPPTFQVGGSTVAAFPTGNNLRGVSYVTGKNTDEEQSVQSSGAAAALGL